MELVKGGTTVFLSSHLLAEVELVCTRAAIVDRGRLVAQDRVEALLGPTGRVLVATPDVGAAADLAAALPGVRLGERRPGRLAVHLDGTAPEALNRRLVDGGVRVRELVVERPTLEDVFLRLTGSLADPVARDPRSPAPRPTPPGGRMFRVELRKLVGRPRTWVTIGLLAGLPMLVAVLLRVTGVGPRPGEGPAFLAQVLGNGALFPAAALALVLPVFLPVAVAVLAGDAVAGEASAGTLRYLLVRPVGRTRLLVAKLGVTAVFVFLAVLVVAAVAFAVGAWLFGVKPLPSVSGQTIAAQDATWRTAVTVAYVAWSMLGVAAVALFASTVTDSPLAAALGAGRAASPRCSTCWTRPLRSNRTCPPTTGWRSSTCSARRCSGATSAAASPCRPCTSSSSSAPPGPTSPPRTSRVELLGAMEWYAAFGLLVTLVWLYLELLRLLARLRER